MLIFAANSLEGQDVLAIFFVGSGLVKNCFLLAAATKQTTSLQWWLQLSHQQQLLHPWEQVVFPGDPISCN